MKLTSEQMIKTAKRLLKPEFHSGMQIVTKSGIDEKGFKFFFRAVSYNQGKNFIGHDILAMNCIDF